MKYRKSSFGERKVVLQCGSQGVLYIEVPLYTICIPRCPLYRGSTVHCIPRCPLYRGSTVHCIPRCPLNRGSTVHCIPRCPLYRGSTVHCIQRFHRTLAIYQGVLYIEVPLYTSYIPRCPLYRGSTVHGIHSIGAIQVLTYTPHCIHM